jgi:16S rRNA (guanine966-N2)-methyltransferase
VAGPKAHQANRVRIIGGAYRRRLLTFPDAPGLRPTPDRVRETLFNWLGQDLPGWACLDLFAGSGALGFEAASRGAGRVIMVERERRTVEALLANRAMLDARCVSVERADSLSWLAANRTPFDLVFVDPPFDSALAEPVLAVLAPHVREGGWVYVEAAMAVAAPPGFAVHRSARAGKSHYALLTKESRC